MKFLFLLAAVHSLYFESYIRLNHADSKSFLLTQNTPKVHRNLSINQFVYAKPHYADIFANKFRISYSPVDQANGFKITIDDQEPLVGMQTERVQLVLGDVHVAKMQSLLKIAIDLDTFAIPDLALCAEIDLEDRELVFKFNFISKAAIQ